MYSFLFIIHSVICDWNKSSINPVAINGLQLSEQQEKKIVVSIVNWSKFILKQTFQSAAFMEWLLCPRHSKRDI